jgi:hypothetical protein
MSAASAPPPKPLTQRDLNSLFIYITVWSRLDCFLGLEKHMMDPSKVSIFLVPTAEGAFTVHLYSATYMGAKPAGALSQDDIERACITRDELVALYHVNNMPHDNNITRTRLTALLQHKLAGTAPADAPSEEERARRGAHVARLDAERAARAEARRRADEARAIAAKTIYVRIWTGPVYDADGNEHMRKRWTVIGNIHDLEAKGWLDEGEPGVHHPELFTATKLGVDNALLLSIADLENNIEHLEKMADSYGYEYDPELEEAKAQLAPLRAALDTAINA